MSKCMHEESRLGYGKPVRKVNGQEIPLKPIPGWDQMHDCDYVDQRNALIPSAETLASRATKKLVRDKVLLLDEDKHGYLWSRCFIESMNVLWSLRTGKLPSTTDPLIEVCRLSEDWTLAVTNGERIN